MGIAVSSRGKGRPTDWATATRASPQTAKPSAVAKTIARVAVFDCNSVMFRLMAEEEFFGIDERPDQVLEVVSSGLPGIDRLAFGTGAWFAEILHCGRQFGRARLARECRQVQLADLRFYRSVVFRQALGAPRGAGEFRLDVGGVDQMQTLGKTRRLNAFTLADALPFRPSKHPEKR